MPRDTISATLQTFKEIVGYHKRGRVIDARSRHCTCVYAESNTAVPVKLVPGVKYASVNYEIFQKAVVNQLSLVIYIGQIGFAASMSGSKTERTYASGTLSNAFDVVVTGDQLQDKVTQLLAECATPLSDVLKAVSPATKSHGDRKLLVSEITSEIRAIFEESLMDVPTGSISTLAYCENEVCIPVKVRVAYNYGKAKENYTELTPHPVCLFILCGSASFVVVRSTDLTTKCPKHEALPTKTRIGDIHSLPGVVSQLFCETPVESTYSLSSFPCHAPRERTANLEKHGENQNLELQEMKRIQGLMASSHLHYWLTPPGCKADAGLSKLCNSLGLQFKTSNFQACFVFHFCTGYEGMLIMCKAIGTDHIIILPGDIATEHITYKPGTARWSPYAVKDDYACKFLTDIFEAVLAKKQEFTWPSGLIQDISQLELVEPSELNKAVSEKGQLELDNIRAREIMFPEFSYVYPETQTTVDVEINQVEVQDKVGDAEDETFWHVKIVKNAGNVDGKRQKKPYSEGDYQALWVFNKNNQDFFLLPAAKLVEHNILACALLPGKQWVSCVTPDYKGRGTQYQWTADYFFKSPISQHDRERLTALLESCKN